MLRQEGNTKHAWDWEAKIFKTTGTCKVKHGDCACELCLTRRLFPTKPHNKNPVRIAARCLRIIAGELFTS